MNRQTIGIVLIAVVSILASLGILALNPIPQDSAYHEFADGRTIWGITNFWNVMSNIPFLLVGVFGIHGLLKDRLKLIEELKPGYLLFFAGVALVSAGSGYYHLFPDNSTLAWDRLPMTIAFMTLFSLIIAEFISIKYGKRLLMPLVILGVLSVVYWHATEIKGNGDLRPYALVQFLPMAIIPIILLCFSPVFDRTSGYWWLLGAYVLAKILEHFDHLVANLPLLLSGHSLKHIVAAIGVLFLINAYRRRKDHA